MCSQTIILIGVILLTANTASTYYNWVIFYAFAQFIFGFGIGGEYPVRFCAPIVLRQWSSCYTHGSLQTWLQHLCEQFIWLKVLCTQAQLWWLHI